VTTYTQEEWRAEAVKRFGKDHKQWKFICPVCKYVQSVQDYIDAEAPQGAIGFSCVGRYVSESKEAFDVSVKEEGPCNYAGGGLFRLNPVKVILPDGSEEQAFAFADPE
jgi:hypothetical protein